MRDRGAEKSTIYTLPNDRRRPIVLDTIKFLRESGRVDRMKYRTSNEQRATNKFPGEFDCHVSRHAISTMEILLSFLQENLPLQTVLGS